MITLEGLYAVVGGLQPSEIERWIAQDWVRPERRGTEIVFREIDVARVRLIADLRHELEVGEEALPVVLSLMDQLYETRRQVRLLCEAIGQAGSDELTQAVLRRLRDRPGETEA